MTSATDPLNDRLIFFVGVNTGFITDGLPDERFVDFYHQRSSSALHCAIVGNVVVPGGHVSNPFTPVLNTNPIWKDIASSISEGGSLPGIQLATVWEGYKGARKFLTKNSERVIEQSRALVLSMGSRAIDITLDSFRDAAALAVEAGFRHIQIHAAHGYLLSLLIDDRIYPRAESVRVKIADIGNWLRAIGAESSIRISMRTGNAELDSVGANTFQDAMAGLPFDFVDLSSGFYNIDKRLIYPSRPEFLMERQVDSISVAIRHPGRRFIISGRALDLPGELPGNVHLGVCRDLIANPRVLKERGNGCQNHGKCHYFSRGSDHITCPRWSESVDHLRH